MLGKVLKLGADLGRNGRELLVIFIVIVEDIRGGEILGQVIFACAGYVESKRA